VCFIVEEVRPHSVLIDFNHPLAGKNLKVSFTIRQVREATPEDLKEHAVCTCDECREGGSHQH
jgi:FKBP-type peptidyl-prolyl cis-trans isomerase 2